MSRLVPLAILALALVGCDPAVQARYQPVSSEDIWPITPVPGVDDEVHELPTHPPALDQTQSRPRACRPPGVLMKSADVVGLRDDRAHLATLEPTLLAGMYEPPMASPPPGPAYRLASWSQHQDVGAKEPIATPSEPSRLEPGRSLYRNEPALYGAWRRDIYAWCNDAANLR
jgi:hypothetical protein